MQLRTVLLVSIVLRVALIAWGEVQDRLLDVKYTGGCSCHAPLDVLPTADTRFHSKVLLLAAIALAAG